MAGNPGFGDAGPWWCGAGVSTHVLLTVVVSLSFVDLLFTLLHQAVCALCCYSLVAVGFRGVGMYVVYHDAPGRRAARRRLRVMALAVRRESVVSVWRFRFGGGAAALF